MEWRLFLLLVFKSRRLWSLLSFLNFSWLDFPQTTSMLKHSLMFDVFFGILVGFLKKFRCHLQNTDKKISNKVYLLGQIVRLQGIKVSRRYVRLSWVCPISSASQQGTLRTTSVWSMPSEILNVRSSITPETVAFSIPWYQTWWNS